MSTGSKSVSLRPQSVVGVPLSRLAVTAGGAALHLPASLSDRRSADERAVDPLITGITLRAQNVGPGDLFAALPGSTVHGAAFVDDARRNGAAAILTNLAGAEAVRAGAASEQDLPMLIAEDPRAVLGAVSAAVYGEPSRSMSVIGVTGTSGKTTTCYLIEAALAAAGLPTGLIGTVETRIDGIAAKSALTTPEAPELQALFAVMVERGVTAAAMEVSSHALSLGRVAGTHYSVGAFTNLSQDHLDFHPDMDSYFRAKALLFDGRAEAGVIDIDDEYGARLAALHPGAVTVSTAGNAAADWSVRDVRPGTAGTQHFVVQAPGGRTFAAELALPGAFNIANALLALACVEAAGLGVDLADAVRGLASVVVPGRMERVDLGQGFLAVVDYAHKPAALSAVLSAVSGGLTGRLIVVVGAGGDRDRGKRALMGANAAAWADLVIVTDDNPRSESPASIRAAILAGTRGEIQRERPGHAEIREVGDRHEAIRAAVAAARPGDAVVIAGKGHEQGQDVAGVVHPFVDRDELAAAIAALPSPGRTAEAGS